MDVGIIRADDRSAPFFAAAARDVLLIKRCARCDRWLDPGATGCPGCGAADPRWEPAAGRGRLISWAVLPGGKPESAGLAGMSETPEAAGAPDVSTVPDPAVLALVELDEGPWLHTRLEGAGGTATAGPRAGLRVIAHFVHPAEGESYPVFRPGE
jgi:uncharacterized protein